MTFQSYHLTEKWYAIVWIIFFCTININYMTSADHLVISLFPVSQLFKLKLHLCSVQWKRYALSFWERMGVGLKNESHYHGPVSLIISCLKNFDLHPYRVSKKTTEIIDENWYFLVRSTIFFLTSILIQFYHSTCDHVHDEFHITLENLDLKLFRNCSTPVKYPLWIITH